MASSNDIENLDLGSVTFFIVPDEDEIALARIACKLASMRCDSSLKTHILMRNEESCTLIDQLMWEYPRDQFIPHENATSPVDSCLVTFSHETTFEGRADVLINTTVSVPTIASQFVEICEIVLGSEQEKGRDRYRQYQDLGFHLHNEYWDNWD